MAIEDANSPRTDRDEDDVRARPALFVPVGENFTKLFGQGAATRAYRLAGSRGLEPGHVERLGEEGGRSTLLADLDFVWDPIWLGEMVDRPGHVLTFEGRAVIAHCTGPADREAVLTAMANEATHALPSMIEIEASERPRRFVMPLEPETQSLAARAAFIAGCEKVTDAITVAIRTGPAFHMARWASRFGIGAATMTLVGVALSLLAALLFYEAWFFTGIVAGTISIIAATAGRGLVRAIGTDAPWRPIHGTIAGTFIPPLWYAGFAHGLVVEGAPPVYATLLGGIAVAGHLVDAVMRVGFRRRHGFALRMWRPFDSRFRLFSVGRNVGLLLLGLGVVFGIELKGMEAVVLWTLISLVIMAVRLAQAENAHLRGRKLESWM